VFNHRCGQNVSREIIKRGANARRADVQNQNE